MELIYRYIKLYLRRIAGSMTVKLLGTVAELMVPYFLEHIIDSVAPAGRVVDVFWWGLVMVVVAFFARLFNVGANRLAIGVSRDATRDIRHELFKKTSNLSGSRFDAFGLPSLTSRMTSDTYNIQSFMQSVQTQGIRGPFMLIGGVVVTMTMDRALSAILCVMIPILAVVVICVSKQGIPLYDKVQRSLDRIVRVMRENITGIRVVKALSKTDYERRRFGGANEEMVQRDVTAGVVMALPAPLMQLFLNVGLALVVLVGAWRVDGGLAKPGVILAFLTYFNMILQGVMTLNKVFMQLTKASASADRIEVVLKDAQDMPVLPWDGPAAPGDVAVEFDHVSFNYKYGGEPQSDDVAAPPGTCERVIDDICFTLHRGESLGIIGGTGSGKTTIVNLMMRFYDTDEGTVLVDGRDVRTYEKDELRRKFGVVFQNDLIFEDTLYENITFGRSVPPEAMDMAARSACASEFIEGMEGGYAYGADIKGANLSGGQKQRILIARALAANPEILVFDDSSSALDYKTDAAFRTALRENYAGSTLVMVAQRVSSIMHMTHILMLEDGKVLGYGTHDELMAGCGAYREIYEVQLGEM
ncbi:MAG: ABC transporter ATP-binding protein/permease [Lachnospiraceae bacterium]|jgi:ATP-binding cassette subfamily B protein|nr:ABC transporter ATP-binding protein/permease [Lachnospiraceae bacterium]